MLIFCIILMSINYFINAEDTVEREGRILNKIPLQDSYVSLGSKLSEKSLRDSLVPPCGNDPAAPFCILDENYPREIVRELLSRDRVFVETLFAQLHRHSSEELVSLDNATHSYRSTGSFACESDVAWVRPGWARDVSGRWLLVVNTPRFPQSIRTEICKFAEKKCEYIPPCYRSRCKQRYSNTHLLALDIENLNLAPFIEIFPVPSGCACFIENFKFF